MEHMGKITFFEDKNFQGRHYECCVDCPELNTHFSRCNSLRVESGSWVLYERPNYMGYQYILTRGEYPDHQRWMGYNDNIRSCRMIENTSDRFRMRIYERPDFSGQMMEVSEDIANVSEHWHYREVHSANIMDGAWVFYELPSYHGRQYILEKAEYRHFTEWGAMLPKVGSIRRVQDS